MSTASDRRAPDASRIPFDGMVEVGGALGPSFEAQAVNLSEEGMHLRTAYLPEVGQPVTCRFDAGQGMVVVAAGEVLWKDDMGNGGEFGIRFTNLDSASTVALQRIVGMVEDGVAVKPPHGRKIRLHIDGLASPMRARVKSVEGTSVTAFSELGFLQVGKQLDLEDAATGSKRPALIDRVSVDIEPETRIPQLVVTLRYDDEEAYAAEMAPMAHHDDSTGRDGSLAPHAMDDEMDEHDAPHQHDDLDHDHVAHEPAVNAASAVDADVVDEDSKKLKSAFARNAAKVTPTLEKWAKRAKTTVALLAARASAKRNGAADDVEIPVRRTTAPAPGGGLTTSGRKVVRGEIEEPIIEEPLEKPRFTMTKKKMAVGGGIGVAVILAMVAMRKPAPPPVAAAPPPDSAALAAAAPPPRPLAPPPMPAAGGPTAVNDPLATAAAALGADPSLGGKNGKATPFGNGPVTHGNVLKIKMDGAVTRIQGASQPSGFTVVIPGRKSLDAAGPLASKDPRIAAIRVSNEPAGAELTVTFKDGVPNYQVKAHGDTLEMHLAKSGHAGDKAPEAHAKPHGKKHH
ncbi:MAG TPA: PilZ domain-containing protein [Labilithrix sp.]|nr:PilZ domain-containing protein [Labilithrix sp.]